MAVDIVMPQMGESIFEGTITKWLKKPGDKVERDEPLFEISTDKVDAEIPSPSAGVLKEIKVGEGQTVPIQTVVGVIDAAGSAAAAAGAPAPAPAKAQAPAPMRAPAAAAPPPAPAAAPRPAAPAPVAVANRAASPPSSPASGRVHSSPLVRRMAKEHGIDLATVQGTGAGGRISKQDIEAVIVAAGGAPGAPSVVSIPAARPVLVPAPAPSGAPGTQAHVALETAVPREKIYFGNYEVQPMSTMRQRIAEHMVASKRVSPHVYSVDE